VAGGPPPCVGVIATENSDRSRVAARDWRAPGLLGGQAPTVTVGRATDWMCEETRATGAGGSLSAMAWGCRGDSESLWRWPSPSAAGGGAPRTQVAGVAAAGPLRTRFESTAAAVAGDRRGGTPPARVYQPPPPSPPYSPLAPSAGVPSARRLVKPRSHSPPA